MKLILTATLIAAILSGVAILGGPLLQASVAIKQSRTTALQILNESNQ